MPLSRVESLQAHTPHTVRISSSLSNGEYFAQTRNVFYTPARLEDARPLVRRHHETTATKRRKLWSTLRPLGEQRKQSVVLESRECQFIIDLNQNNDGSCYLRPSERVTTSIASDKK